MTYCCIMLALERALKFGMLIALLFSTVLVRECRTEDKATALAVTTDSETSTGAEVILSATDATLKLTEATLTCIPDCTDPAPDYVPDADTGKLKITLTGLTPATQYTINVAAVSIKSSNLAGTDSFTAPPEKKFCTKGADLALKVGEVTSDSVEVTWTKASEGQLPDEYKLAIDGIQIGTVPKDGDAKFTFDKIDAQGTGLEENKDYTCKITAPIAAFASGDCPAEELISQTTCKATSTGGTDTAKTNDESSARAVLATQVVLLSPLLAIVFQ